MKRTQLYIDEGLLSVLSQLSREKKTTISELVRNALEKFYGRENHKSERVKAFKAACGMWAGHQDIDSTEKYLRALRKGSRLKRFARTQSS